MRSFICEIREVCDARGRIGYDTCLEAASLSGSSLRRGRSSRWELASLLLRAARSGEADLPRAEGPAMDLVNPRPARTRRRAWSSASHSARLRRGPSYGPAGPRSIGGEPTRWCAVPTGPSRAWRSCSSPRLARGAFSHESPAVARFSRRALVYSERRRRARTGWWKAPVVSSDLLVVTLLRVVLHRPWQGPGFALARAGAGTVVGATLWCPPSGACGAFVAAHRASSPLACSAPPRASSVCASLVRWWGRACIGNARHMLRAMPFPRCTN